MSPDPRSLALWIALACVPACSAGEESKLPEDAPPYSVLLVTVDTLRADHLCSYGYFRETSPRMDALAAEGVMFERAVSASGTTLPSHLSIMTGLLPHQHGVVANRGAMRGPFRSFPGRRPAAEYFREAGYATAAFTSGATVKTTTGIQTGFELFDEPEAASRAGVLTNARALEWLAERAKSPEAPFFLWIHYWDTHEPNDPPEPYASMFAADERVLALLDEHLVDAESLQETHDPFDIVRLFFPDLVEAMILDEDNVDVPKIGREDVLQLYDRYDGDVRYVDDRVGEVLDTLDTLGLSQHTVFALVSDHGQALGQHDWLEHGRVRTEEVHVPMMVRFPGEVVEQPKRIERVVSTIDLLPTIAARIGLAGFLEQAAGEDVLSPAFERPFAFSHRSERHRRQWEPGRKFALTFERYKYYHLEDGADQLFDTRLDPAELQDLAPKQPDVVARMQRIVRNVLEDRPSRVVPGETDSEGLRADMLQELRALGYAGGDRD